MRQGRLQHTGALLGQDQRTDGRYAFGEYSGCLRHRKRDVPQPGLDALERGRCICFGIADDAETLNRIEVRRADEGPQEPVEFVYTSRSENSVFQTVSENDCGSPGIVIA